MPLFSRAGRAPSEAPTFTDEPAERPRMSTLMRSQRKLLLLEIGADGLFQYQSMRARDLLALVRRHVSAISRPPRAHYYYY